MEFEIITVTDRSLLAEGQVTAVRMDRQSSRSRPPPPAIREGFARTATESHSVDNRRSRNQSMEATLRFASPETLGAKVFGRLSAWQNWIFRRPYAVGEHGALTSFGKPLQQHSPKCS
jgi:hypothetical protein